jgi:TatD family-associated radical SAM protein
MNKSSSKFNLGNLKGKIIGGNQIVYYKRGLEELSLNITNNCPNSCVFCIRDKDPGWGVANLYLDEEPSLNQILSAFEKESEKINGEGVVLKKVKICGYGEPLLRPRELFAIVEHVHKKCPSIKIQIATSGWPYFKFYKTSNSLKKLKKLGASHIYLSLNATESREYQRIVRPGINFPNKKAFSNAVKFAKMAQEIGYNLTVGFVDLPNTNKKKIIDFCDGLKLNYQIREFEN